MTTIDQVRRSTTTGWFMPAHRTHHHHRCRALLVLLGALCAALCLAPTAQAAGPQLSVSLTHDPATFQRGDLDADVIVTVTNVGDAPTGGPVSATLVLPPALQLRSVFRDTAPGCPSPQSVNAGAPFTCTTQGALAPGGSATTLIQGSLTVAADAGSELTTSVTASAAGAPDVTAEDHIPVIDRGPFVPLDFSARSLDSAGNDDTVAGGHPYEATTSFAFHTFRSDTSNISFPGEQRPVEDVRNIWVELPPGFVGAASAAPRCTVSQLTSGSLSQPCPPATQVGTLTLDTPTLLSSGAHPFYNLTPEPGYPAEFAFKLGPTAIVSYAQLRPRGGGYGLNITVPGADRFVIRGVSATLWGVPSQLNGTGGPPIPFLSNPADCLDAQPTTKIYVDSWEHPARMQSDGTPDLSDPNWKSSSAPAPAITGCDAPALADQFKPSISLEPTSDAGGSHAADTPSGYRVDLSFPQSNDPTDPSTVFDPSIPQAPALKDATVTLPAGVSINPSAADGLDGCSDAPGDDQVQLNSINPVTCSEASKIGSVIAQSPLLASHDPETDAVTGMEPIDGDVYLLKPHTGDLSASGDGDGHFRILIQLESERYGLNVKLPGIVTADKDTGQLTARFTNNPQLPVKSLHLTFKGGDRAPLVNPRTCTAAATTTGVFTPWSRGGTRSDGTVVPGTPDATSSSSFAIDQGANGAPCASSPAELPFSPGFSAGVLSPEAGGSSPLVLRFTRSDGEQELGSIDATLPPGLLGNIGGVPLCPQAQAAAGTCDAASQIGTTTVGAGAGPSPFFLPQAGRDPTAVYLAGPYKGAPLSLSIVVPAQAGPFDLGNVVVRAALFIDPHDAHVSVKSDPIPTIRDGVPLRIRDVRVNIDRPGFMASPTNCKEQSISALLASAEGKSASVSSPFAVSGCSKLKFKPKLSASTSGKTSKAAGASLVVKLSQQPGEASIAKVDLTLPVALPSRLSTLQKACTEAQFAANPAGCPEGSVIGSATARTPLLQTPLTGPAYLVSHGGEAFPDVVFMLQANERGSNVRVDLVGNTQIKKGITYSRFETVPDAPISSFEANLPEGPHSVLTANGNLCQKALLMPTEMVAQNGALAMQSTKIALTGCPKAAIKVKSRRVAHRAVKLTVAVSAPGRLSASGNGLTTTSRRIRGAGTVTLLLRAKRPGKLSTKIKLGFVPEEGKALSTALRLRMKG
ncbi:MAG TPA: hypothetical protein VIH85_24535 [Solirubrobacteraceae bacterium]